MAMHSEQEGQAARRASQIIDAAEMLAQHNMIVKDLASKDTAPVSLPAPSTLQPSVHQHFLRYWGAWFYPPID